MPCRLKKTFRNIFHLLWFSASITRVFMSTISRYILVSVVAGITFMVSSTIVKHSHLFTCCCSISADLSKRWSLIIGGFRRRRRKKKRKRMRRGSGKRRRSRRWNIGRSVRFSVELFDKENFICNDLPNLGQPLLIMFFIVVFGPDICFAIQATLRANESNKCVFKQAKAAQMQQTMRLITFQS